MGIEVDKRLYSVETTSRGDIAALFDLSGRCVESMRYSSFGERERFGESISPWGFAGKRHDPSGFVYFGRRYYLPSEGRWMAPDPYGPIDGPNLYQFCHNNPHAFIDWVGLYGETFVMGGCGGSCGPDYVGSSQTTVNTRIYFGDTRPSGFGGSGVISGGSMAGLHNPVHFAGFGNMQHAMSGFENHMVQKAQHYHQKLGPTFQGGVQTFCGMLEISFAYGLTMTGGGIPFAVVLAAHGFDNAFAGVQTVWRGEVVKNLTCQTLEMAGVPPEWADATDTAIGMMLPVGVTAVMAQEIRASAVASQQAARAMQSFTVIEESRGYRSFAAFKRAEGSSGHGMAWHHIVEQTPGNIARFGRTTIHNTNNLVRLPHGPGTIHNEISRYYSSIKPFTKGQTVRQWLSTQSFEEQAAFGWQIMIDFGWTP